MLLAAVVVIAVAARHNRSINVGVGVAASAVVALLFAFLLSRDTCIARVYLAVCAIGDAISTYFWRVIGFLFQLASGLVLIIGANKEDWASILDGVLLILAACAKVSDLQVPCQRRRYWLDSFFIICAGVLTVATTMRALISDLGYNEMAIIAGATVLSMLPACRFQVPAANSIDGDGAMITTMPKQQSEDILVQSPASTEEIGWPAAETHEAEKTELKFGRRSASRALQLGTSAEEEAAATAGIVSSIAAAGPLASALGPEPHGGKHNRNHGTHKRTQLAAVSASASKEEQSPRCAAERSAAVAGAPPSPAAENGRRLSHAVSLTVLAAASLELSGVGPSKKHGTRSEAIQKKSRAKNTAPGVKPSRKSSG